MTKEELKQEALKHSEPKSIIDLIDEAYQAGQEAERERVTKIVKEKGLHLGYANNIINLINTKE